MKAARYRVVRGVARLELIEAPAPSPGTGEVRVRIHSSGVNPVDLKRASAGHDDDSCWIPHDDGAGVIDQVGPGVPEDRIGERVWVHSASQNRYHGTAAEFVCLPADCAVPLADTVSFDRGAGLGVPYLTAHRTVHVGWPAQPGQRVLVTGAAGAVGCAAVSMLRAAGAEVLGVVGDNSKATIARAAGAQHVLDRTTHDFAARLEDIAGPGFDRIIEVSLPADLSRLPSLLAPGGSVVVYGSHDTASRLPIIPLLRLNANIHFVMVFGLPVTAIEHALIDLPAYLRLPVALPTRVFDLAHIAEAHRAVRDSRPGKVLVRIPTSG